MRTMNEHPKAPFLIAHRAGNDLASLRSAEAAGVALVEADVHRFRGRLEVRHLKTLGPLPVLWDRWELAPPWRPRLLLGDLLAHTAPGTELMLDLKGRSRRLAGAVAAALDARSPGAGRITVCSRIWHHLEPLAARADVRVLHSVGSRAQLRALLARMRAGARFDGVSIHQGLLDEAVAARLRDAAGVVVTWPVETRSEAQRLAALGVDGLISKSFMSLAGGAP